MARAFQPLQTPSQETRPTWRQVSTSSQPKRLVDFGLWSVYLCSILFHSSRWPNSMGCLQSKKISPGEKNSLALMDSWGSWNEPWFALARAPHTHMRINTHPVSEAEIHHVSLGAELTDHEKTKYTVEQAYREPWAHYNANKIRCKEQMLRWVVLRDSTHGTLEIHCWITTRDLSRPALCTPLQPACYHRGTHKQSSNCVPVPDVPLDSRPLQRNQGKL